jgi:glycosyltransferase involved in cell wall biosynthesis
MHPDLKKIQILHINTAGTWRGGEKQTFYLVYHLNKRGYSSFCICRKDSSLHQKLAFNNLPHFPLKIRSGFDIIAAKGIARICGELNAKILHLHTSHAHSLGFLSSLFYRVPVSIVSRRVDFRISKNIFSRIKYNYPDMYIAVSNAVRDILIKDRIPPDKVVTVYSGVDTASYNGADTEYLNREFSFIPGFERKIRLVNTAALTHQKDHETLIKAIGILKDMFRDFILIIAGEGELKRHLLSLCKSLSLEENIVFTGFREDALNLTAFADIFVISSRWEGLGTSIIDAMALGKPVIAAETGGIPELIKDNMNGLLVPKEDPWALAETIFRLISDEPLRKRLSEQAHKDARNFTIEKTVDRTIEVYMELWGAVLNN